MKAIITGIAGFIGFHTAQRLAAEGVEVVGVDCLTPYYDVRLKHARLERLMGQARFQEMDVAENERFAALVAREKPDVVIHLAAQAGVRYSIEAPFAYAHANLTGHLSVLEACRRSDSVGHLVYASSSSVYGGTKTTPFRETDNVDEPVSLYAATKRADEIMSSTYAHLYGVKQAGLRFFTVYGEWGRPDMAYWTFTDALLNARPIRVFNHGDMRRDFTYIDDIVEGVAAIARRAPEFTDGERPHRVYNIGNNQPTNLMDFIRVLEDATGHRADMEMDEMQPGDMRETYADIDRIQAEYGFAPKTAVEEGLPRFVRWYRDYHDV